MDFWKDLTLIIQAAVTSVGIIVGAVWTYLIFVRERLRFPKINIELIIEDIKIQNNARIVHAEVKLNNIGHVLLRSHHSELRLRKIVPIHDELKPDVEKGFDPVSNDRIEIEWPLIAGREWKWDENEFEIEPGEGDSLHADYIISSDVQVVEFYFYIANAKKKTQGIGWTLTKIHEFENEGGNIMADHGKGNNSKESLNEQQRQQKQQKPQQQQQQTQQQTQDKKKK
jgi:hypothetical protein